MSTTEAKKVVKKYAKKLRDNNCPVSSMYLFGSYANGRARAESDIDVAVVSDPMVYEIKTTGIQVV